jgi:hypothetical protein
MFRRIVILSFSLIAYLVVVYYQVDAQQAPSAGVQPGARSRGPIVPTPPPLFFKETWRIVCTSRDRCWRGRRHQPKSRIQDVRAISNGHGSGQANLDISGPPGPVNIWTGMCMTPFCRNFT